ncbi:MAG: agmatinase [Candidatus Micrarchaeota archaeon]|nr:agmatinase [Candidatus Micrarchaeota archaeon]MBU1886833.1 agmatinase [Candidatus Micrarchaeota archaeon]
MTDTKNRLLNLCGIKRAFLGFQSSLDEAEVVVMPVPYEATTSYHSGTRFGPNAIIDASTQVELYDIELDKDICNEITIHTLDELEIDKGSPERMMENIAEAVGCVLKLGKKPVIFGGEHSITGGILSGIHKTMNEPISVLQIDAHADLRDSYEGTKNNHACAMCRVREFTKNTVQVGIRSMSEEEMEYIKTEKIGNSIFYADRITKNRKNGIISDKDVEAIISGLKSKKVYVTIDVDGFDPSVISGTGTPEPGGLLWNDVLSIMREVGKRKEIVGFDIVELSPSAQSHVSEFTAAKLAYKMIGYFWSRK